MSKNVSKEITIGEYVSNFNEMIKELSDKIDYLGDLAEGDDDMKHIVSIHRECFDKYLLSNAERLMKLYGSVETKFEPEYLPESFAAFEELRSSMTDDLVHLEKQIRDVKWLHKMVAEMQPSM